jgi:hypothetical protein
MGVRSKTPCTAHAFMLEFEADGQPNIEDTEKWVAPTFFRLYKGVMEQEEYGKKRFCAGIQ